MGISVTFDELPAHEDVNNFLGSADLFRIERASRYRMIEIDFSFNSFTYGPILIFIQDPAVCLKSLISYNCSLTAS